MKGRLITGAISPVKLMFNELVTTPLVVMKKFGRRKFRYVKPFI